MHLLSGCQQHDPLLCGLIPEEVRITEVGDVADDDRILLVFRKRAATICRIGHRLGLSLRCRGVVGNDGILAVASRVVLIHHARAAEDGADGIRLNGVGQCLPVDEVF